MVEFQNSKSHSSGVVEFQNSKSHSSGVVEFQNSKSHSPELENFKIQNSKSHSSGVVEFQNSKSCERILKFKKLQENSPENFNSGPNYQKPQDSTLKNFKTQLSKTQGRKKNHEIMKFVFCPKQQKNSF